MAPPLTSADELVSSLTLELVVSSDAPLVLLDAELAVIAASRTFGTAFTIATEAIRGHPLGSIGHGEWNRPQLNALLTATASGLAAISGYEMELVRPGFAPRTLLLSAHVLESGGKHGVLVMPAVTDVTDARLAARHTEALTRDKMLLVQEMQHRVANSLQIIASVLMQSARRVQSHETRGHLEAAHNRVMSVASVQRQLAGSGTEDVQLRPYFEQLCMSLAASMIQNPDQLQLRVICDDSVVPAAESISLGLVVTELVINALKHAFPDDRHGTIEVGFAAEGAGWHLSVSDDGVGMSGSSPAGKPGLGTSIVEALSKQLGANVAVRDTAPGTSVTLVHKAISATNDNPPAAARAL